LGENDDLNVLKDPAMLKRLNELNSLSEPDRDSILYALDGLLRDAKARKAYAMYQQNPAISRQALSRKL